MGDLREPGWAVVDDGEPFNALVGPLWTRGEDGQREFGFEVQRKHLSRFGRLHGAMLLWLADKSMGMAAWHLVGRPQQHATVQLDTHFLEVVPEGAFVHSRCELVRSTRTLAFMRCTMHTDGRAVAAASGVWKYR